MEISEKSIEKYVRNLGTFLKRNVHKSRIDLGNPNDKHLRIYIKNIYLIKLLFPKTINIELSINGRTLRDLSLIGTRIKKR
jgi:hypothetical protein